MKGLYCMLGEAKELKFIIQETVSIDSIVRYRLFHLRASHFIR